MPVQGDHLCRPPLRRGEGTEVDPYGGGEGRSVFYVCVCGLNRFVTPFGALFEVDRHGVGLDRGLHRVPFGVLSSYNVTCILKTRPQSPQGGVYAF